jgi:hypothetical protein
MALDLVLQATELSSPITEVGILLAGVSALIAAVTLGIRVIGRRSGGGSNGYEALRAEFSEVRRNQQDLKDSVDIQVQDMLRHRVELFTVLSDVKRHLERQDDHLGRQDNVLVQIGKQLEELSDLVEEIHRHTTQGS